MTIAFLTLFGCNRQEGKRYILSLNGEWQLAVSSSIQDPPQDYTSKVPVPGLVDLAEPAVDDGSYEGRIYWYRTQFTLPETDSEIQLLKINKAKYHTRLSQRT